MSNKTHMSYKTNLTNKTNPGGYENLHVYHLGVLIYDLNTDFCKKYLSDLRHKRTVEQMIQAARSGKQNIVEGILEKSVESCLKLIGVSRASYGELIEDYKDFLIVNKLRLRDKNEREILFMRKIMIDKNINSNKEKVKIFLNTPEVFANLMITLIYRQTYMLDRLLKVFENKFIEEGGFRENLFKKRIDYRNRSG